MKNCLKIEKKINQFYVYKNYHKKKKKKQVIFQISLQNNNNYIPIKLKRVIAIYKHVISG